MQLIRISYEMYIGAIDKGLVIEHVCRKHCCVNPFHCEPVSNLENLQRRFAITGKATHCYRGHELIGDNFRLNTKGQKYCKICADSSQERRKKIFGVTEPAPGFLEGTHCLVGHEYTVENTFVYDCGRRECRACRRITKEKRLEQPYSSLNQGDKCYKPKKPM